MINYKKGMNRFILIEVIIMILGLTSCGIFGKTINQMMNSDLDANAAADSQKKVVEAFIAQDASSLKKLLTKNAINKIDNLDAKLNEAIIFCKGQYVSHEYHFSTGGYNSYGKKQITIDLFIRFKTIENTYVIDCQQMVYDDFNNDLGIFRLSVIEQSMAEYSTDWKRYRENPEEPAIEIYYEGVLK